MLLKIYRRHYHHSFCVSQLIVRLWQHTNWKTIRTERWDNKKCFNSSFLYMAKENDHEQLAISRLQSMGYVCCCVCVIHCYLSNNNKSFHKGEREHSFYDEYINPKMVFLCNGHVSTITVDSGYGQHLITKDWHFHNADNNEEEQFSVVSCVPKEIISSCVFCACTLLPYDGWRSLGMKE